MPDSASKPPKVLFLLTEDWFFLSHFADRARAARDAGFDVVVAARDNGRAAEIRGMGFTFREIPFRRRGFNPFRESGTIVAIRRLYRAERPDIVHHIALKPILYGSLVAGAAKIMNAPVGMGFVFASETPLARLLRPLIRLGLRGLLNPGGSRVVFENRDDLAALIADGSVRAADAVLIPGAGVDLRQFAPRPEPDGRIRVVLVARMLREKGVPEFVEAARLLRQRQEDIEFVLVGAPDEENPSSLTAAELEGWQREGVVRWEGQRSDVAAIMAGCHVVTLPSYYREGLPKVLLEAMASARPIIATDVIGCREAVTHGDNGLLVPPRDAAALAGAIATLAGDGALRRRMGARGRELAETIYATEITARQTLDVYGALLGSKTSA